jgi:hypothetical protein
MDAGQRPVFFKKAISMKHDKNVTATVGHLIDGQIVHEHGRTQPVFNPATGSRPPASSWPAGHRGGGHRQRRAFPAWRNTPPLKRARVMSKLKVLLEAHADEIAALITAEHGKVLTDAHGELQRGIENVEYASYAPELLKGEHSRNAGPGIDSWPSTSRWAWWPASRPSTFRPWCRCGCGRWPWPAATPSSQAQRARSVVALASPSWRWKPACPAC